MWQQLVVLVGIYALAGLPLWLTPVAIVAEKIRNLQSGAHPDKTREPVKLQAASPAGGDYSYAQTG